MANAVPIQLLGLAGGVKECLCIGLRNALIESRRLKGQNGGCFVRDVEDRIEWREHGDPVQQIAVDLLARFDRERMRAGADMVGEALQSDLEYGRREALIDRNRVRADYGASAVADEPNSLRIHILARRKNIDGTSNVDRYAHFFPVYPRASLAGSSPHQSGEIDTAPSLENSIAYFSHSLSPDPSHTTPG